MESFDSFYNFVKCIQQGKWTRDIKSIDVAVHTELLEVIKDEPDSDIKDDVQDSTAIADTLDPTTRCDEFEEDNCTSVDSSNERTRQSKRRRTASPSTSTRTNTKKFKTDSHSSLLSKYFNMSCDLCDTLLTSYRDTNQHYKDVHDLEKGYLICCGKKFYRLQHMLQHCEWHINPECFK